MTSDATYRVVFAAVVLTGLVVAGRLRSRADRTGGRVSRTEDPIPIRIALGATAGPFLAGSLAWLVNPGWMEWGALPLPAFFRWTAVVVALAAVAVGAWILDMLGRNVTPTSAVREDATLVTEGPYRRVRHPLYTNSLFFYGSLGVVAANAFLLACAIATFLVLAWRSRIEEARLEKRFGRAYREYRDRSGRFLPPLSRWLESSRKA